VAGSTTQGWTYDANGNRLTETGSTASTYTISATNNRVSSITGALPRSYTYDAAGNVRTYSTVTGTYNDRGRLQSLQKGLVTETLLYNALGQMMETSGGAAGTVLYMYDEAGHLEGEYSGAGVLIEETVWLGDIPVATLRRTGAGVAVYYVEADHLNTPRQVTRPSDNKQMWTWFSDPFGTTVANSNPAGAGAFTYNLRFPGQIYDSQAGLQQNMRRDFDPQTGRYVESDPIGLMGGINTYGYVANNPISWIDPWGTARLPYDEIARIVAQENLSGLSNELIICLIWKESSFSPLSQSLTTTSRGLMQVTKGALQDVQSNWTGFGSTTYNDLYNGTTNVSVGTAYVSTRIDWTHGNVQNALNGYGTGPGYSDNIFECERCLKSQAPNNTTQCTNPYACLNKIHK
jgi:RHS repeat-associated protein